MPISLFIIILKRKHDFEEFNMLIYQISMTLNFNICNSPLFLWRSPLL